MWICGTGGVEQKLEQCNTLEAEFSYLANCDIKKKKLHRKD
jgi:hypothetical protein